MISEILIFLFMNKVLQSTSRGQVTLPKSWRDQFDTKYFEAEFDGEVLTIKPLKSRKSFGQTVEAAWNEYKNGDCIASEDLIKQYGL